MENLEILDKIIIGRVNPHIYAFTTNTVPNYLKIGDTYRPVEERLNEWRMYYPELIKQYQEKALVNDDIFFRDYAVHKFVENNLKKIRLKPNELEEGIYFSNEFFKDATSDDIIMAIDDIKNKYELNSSDYQYYSTTQKLPQLYKYSSTGMWDLRPNQKEVVEKFKNAVDSGRNNLLMYAVMRFGKSFTALMCAKEIQANIVVVVSAKADVKEEWKKTVQSAENFNQDYEFFTSDDLLNNSEIIKQNIEENKKVVIFLTLQDLSGTTIKEKHTELFKNEIDLLIIDESHFGARAEKYGEAIKNYEVDKKSKFHEEDIVLEDLEKNIKVLKSKIKLHLSGTPYRILMGSEFKEEDIICFCQFTDIADEKEKWDRKYLLKDEIEEWENPYYGFPQMVRFAFNPSKKAKEKIAEYENNGYSFALSSLFKPQSIQKNSNNDHKKFINENEILEIFKAIDGSENDENILPFLNYDKIKDGKMCRHIVCVLPYCASCDALEALLCLKKTEFKNLRDYEIINISGLETSKLYKKVSDIKNKIAEYENQDKKTITLTVNRMLTGSTVQQWDTMLYFKDTSSPQEYDQAIFRLQNQFIKEYTDENSKLIKFNMKPQTILVDFDIQRMFYLQEQKSLFSTANLKEVGNTNLKSNIEKDLKISPIITLNKDKIVEVTANDIMLEVSKYSKNRGIMEEANEIPVDLNLLNIDEIRKIISKQSELSENATFSMENIDEEENADDFDLPNEIQQEDVDDTSELPEKNKSEDKELNPIKQFRTYYARLLFFAFLTDDKIISLNDILSTSNDENNRRILKNLGIEVAIIKLFIKNMDVFKLNQLDNKIQNINNLANDISYTPVERAIVAINKFKRLSDSEYITPTETCNNMINMIDENDLINILENGGKILDIASKMAEFSITIYDKVKSKTSYDISSSMYAIPTSSISYEFTRKIFEILNLNIENIASKFNAYDLLKISSDEADKYLYQNKKFCEIELQEDLFFEERNENMKFEVVVGNPPYQVSDGGAQASAQPIYQHFVDVSKKVATKYSTLIIPARWYVGGKGLDEFRNEMITDNHIKILNDCLTPEDIFSNTNIRGGICYFLRDTSYNNLKNQVEVNTIKGSEIIQKAVRPLKISDYDIFIRDSKATTILEKIKSNETKMEKYISSLRPFGLRGYFSKSDDYKATPENMNEPIICYAKGKQIGFVETNYIKNNTQWIDKWKVFIPRANNIGTELNDDNLNSFVGKPKEICTESYLVVGVDLNLNEDSANNLAKYLRTKFFRYLHSISKSSQDATSKTFKFVPVENFSSNNEINWSKSIKEIDESLYKKYSLNVEEISHIENTIKEME